MDFHYERTSRAQHSWDAVSHCALPAEHKAMSGLLSPKLMFVAYAVAVALMVASQCHWTSIEVVLHEIGI